MQLDEAAVDLAQAFREQAAERELGDDERARHRDVEQEAERGVLLADLVDDGARAHREDVHHPAQRPPLAVALEPATGEVLRERPHVDAVDFSRS